MNILKKLCSEDGSVKFLFELESGDSIETLYMYDKNFLLTYHSTVCVSSQVGCAMGCKFCATGLQGFVRNLTVKEIFEQVDICNRHCLEAGNAPIDAIVFAGMGEPLLNYENIKAAIHVLNSRLGIKNFELVTVGVVPGIYRMAKDFEDSSIHIRLNLSLHASEDQKRKSIISYSNTYDIQSILSAAADYAVTTNTKARIRYTLFKGFNDKEDDAVRLCRLMENKPFKLILSQYNDNKIQGLMAPSQAEVEVFYNKLKGKIDCGLFHNFGRDIQGGCGQLRRDSLV